MRLVGLVLAMTVPIGGTARAAEPGETVEINAEGVGATAGDAEKQAILSAVQQAVGMFMDSETLIHNEEIVYDKVLSVSNGFVSDYKVTVPAHQRRMDDLVAVSIVAVVRKGKVGAELRKAHLISEEVDGANVWAEAATKVQSARDGYALLEEHLPKLAGRLLRAALVDSRGNAGADDVRPEIKPDPTSDAALCTWNIAVSFDRGTYYDEVVPMLRQALAAVAERKPDGLTDIRRPILPPRGKGGRQVAILGAPVRFRGGAPEVPEWGSRDQFGVFLNVRSDRTAESQQFQCFVLNKEMFAPMFEESFGPIRLRIQFLDGEGAVLHDGVVPLDTVLLARLPRKGGRPKLDAVDAERLELVATPMALFPRWNYYGSGRSRANPGSSVWISPEFFVSSRVSVQGTAGSYLGAAVLSTILRYQISLAPDDLKAFRRVQFSFERIDDPRRRPRIR